MMYVSHAARFNSVRKCFTIVRELKDRLPEEEVNELLEKPCTLVRVGDVTPYNLQLHLFFDDSKYLFQMYSSLNYSSNNECSLEIFHAYPEYHELGKQSLMIQERDAILTDRSTFILGQSLPEFKQIDFNAYTVVPYTCNPYSFGEMYQEIDGSTVLVYAYNHITFDRRFFTFTYTDEEEVLDLQEYTPEFLRICRDGGTTDCTLHCVDDKDIVYKFHADTPFKDSRDISLNKERKFKVMKTNTYLLSQVAEKKDFVYVNH